MDELEDTQNEPDVRNVPIERVGIRDLSYPIRFRDDKGGVQATVARVAVSVALCPGVRGTHMSRFVALISEEAEEISVAEFPRLLERVSARLESSAATLCLEFPYFLTKEAPATKSPGKVDYNVRLEGSWEEGKTSVWLSLHVPITTLCPCSRNISERGAHNQRGVVILTVVGSEGLPPIGDLIAAVEACGSSELYSILKRPDEKHVTERAYDNPVFVEDLVRNVALGVRDLPGVESYRVEAENFESIHNHNAFAVVVSG